MVSEKGAALRKTLASRRTRTAASEQKRLARRTPLRTFWWWLSLVVLAASGGFIPPAIAMAYSVTEGWDGVSQFALLFVAGLLQGVTLGIGEVIALRRGPLRVPAGRWILVTTLAMGVAWIFALLPGSFPQLDLSNPVVLAAVILAVLAAILFVPFSQWFILRARVRDAWRWMLIFGVATALGAGAFVSGIALAAGQTSFFRTLLPFILTGWVGVFLFTLVSGLGVLWIAREALTEAETSAILARRIANESKATKATKAAAARVGKRVGAAASPALRKVASGVTTAAKKVGSKTAAAAKKTATRAEPRTPAAGPQARTRTKKASSQ